MAWWFGWRWRPRENACWGVEVGDAKRQPPHADYSVTDEQNGLDTFTHRHTYIHTGTDRHRQRHTERDTKKQTSKAENHWGKSLGHAVDENVVTNELERVFGSSNAVVVVRVAGSEEGAGVAKAKQAVAKPAEKINHASNACVLSKANDALALGIGHAL